MALVLYPASPGAGACHEAVHRGLDVLNRTADHGLSQTRCLHDPDGNGPAPYRYRPGAGEPQNATGLQHLTTFGHDPQTHTLWTTALADG